MYASRRTKPPKLKTEFVIDDAGVGRGDVVGADLGTLIGIPDIVEYRAGAGSPAHHIHDIELVIAVGILEPGARVVEVDMNRIGGRELIIHAVKDVLFIALGVEDLEFRRVEKAAGIQSIEFEEIAPVLAAVAEVN